MRVEVFREAGNVLGEGPAWDPDTSSLLWVDVRTDRVFLVSLAGGEDCQWVVRGAPSAVIRTSRSDFLVPAGRVIYRLDAHTGNVRSFKELPGEPRHNRCNDAKCDPLGNLWIGTMDDRETASTGRLWRLSAAGETKPVLDSLGIPNTLAWDTERGRFYLADSMLGEIYVFDYDASRAEIGESRVFVGREAASGSPDGSAIDEHGCLWNARWDGSCIVRITPDGNIDRTVEVPALRPTSCAFGDTDGKTLFVTSASAPASGPRGSGRHDGAVFTLRCNVAGAPVPAYRG